MKLTEKPIPQAPPPVTYVLELSFEELVTLALWSHRHEMKSSGSFPSFLRSVPQVVQDEASRRAGEANRKDPGRGLGAGATYNSIDWRKAP